MIYNDIVADYNDARRKRITAVVDLLSPLIGDAQTKAKNDGVVHLDDAAMIALISSHIKNLKITLNALYDSANASTDVVNALITDVSYLNHYLPKQLTSDEIISIIQGLGMSNMGAVMGHFKTNYAGQYDGKELSLIAKVECAKL